MLDGLVVLARVVGVVLLAVSRICLWQNWSEHLDWLAECIDGSGGRHNGKEAQPHHANRIAGPCCKGNYAIR